MNTTIRRILTANRLSRRVYFAARQKYRISQLTRRIDRCFVNADELNKALNMQSGTGMIDLLTTDGLIITIRQNYGDAMTVAEVFLSNCYTRDLKLSQNPIVIDIGGFIGDFSLYAVKRLNAARVIVCEPSPHNWALLLKNINSNGFHDRIEPVHKAVTDGRNMMMNINVPDEEQCMVSAYNSNEQPLFAVPGITLAELLSDHNIECVDLLKMDCEGAEYAIIESTPADVFSRIRNIVFEYHQIDGIWGKLQSVKKRLRREGYTLHRRGGLISAWRP